MNSNIKDYAEAAEKPRCRLQRVVQVMVQRDTRQEEECGQLVNGSVVPSGFRFGPRLTSHLSPSVAQRTSHSAPRHVRLHGIDQERSRRDSTFS